MLSGGCAVIPLRSRPDSARTCALSMALWLHACRGGMCNPLPPALNSLFPLSIRSFRAVLLWWC
eukprot:5509411-Alexandrium_andersonii.AAC.1